MDIQMYARECWQYKKKKMASWSTCTSIENLSPPTLLSWTINTLAVVSSGQNSYQPMCCLHGKIKFSFMDIISAKRIYAAFCWRSHSRCYSLFYMCHYWWRFFYTNYPQFHQCFIKIHEKNWFPCCYESMTLQKLDV